MRFPLSKLGPVRTTKRDVVKARPQLIKRLCTRWGGMLVNAEQRAAKEPHDVVERAGVLVEHRIGAEQSLIPGPGRSRSVTVTATCAIAETQPSRLQFFRNGLY